MSAQKKRERVVPDMNTLPTRTKKRRMKLEPPPQVSNLADLIALGKGDKCYTNINMIRLLRVVPHLEELAKMIGLEEVKKTIFTQTIYYLQDMHLRGANKTPTDGDYLHTLIIGPPGHGKTVVAKIISKIYQAMGILSENGPFVTVKRSDLIGEYLGTTSPKTEKVLQSSIGGVLFIDEVYSLAPRDNDRDSFSKEAIDAINSFLSEHKHDVCCIVAGYEDDVKKCFFQANQGLESRFPWKHKIVEYTPKEKAQIFVKMAEEKKWSLDFNESFLEEKIRGSPTFFKNAGRDIETFLSKCKMCHAIRVFGKDESLKYTMTKDDVSSTFEDMKKGEKDDDHPYRSMYM